MQPIDKSKVQPLLEALVNQELYIHLEMTLGAYAVHSDRAKHPASTFVKNAKIQYSLGTITGEGPYRVGLKMDEGWVYSEGLTHFEQDEKGRLILAGHDHEGKLIVALQLGKAAF